MAHMKGIDAPSEKMRGNKFYALVGWIYLKNISYLLTKLSKLLLFDLRSSILNQKKGIDVAVSVVQFFIFY